MVGYNHRERKINMSFTRKELKKIFTDADIEVPKDVLTQICDLHTSTNDDLVEEHKKEIEKLKGDGEETVKKSEYDKINKELETLKESIATKETRQAKESALQKMYKALGVPDNMIKLAIKSSDIDSVELDADGKIKDEAKLKEQAIADWGSVIEHKDEKGANTPNPPANPPAKKTKEEIMAIKDTSERQKEIAKNLDLFE